MVLETYQTTENEDNRLDRDGIGNGSHGTTSSTDGKVTADAGVRMAAGSHRCV